MKVRNQFILGPLLIYLIYSLHKSGEVKLSPVLSKTTGTQKAHLSRVTHLKINAN